MKPLYLLAVFILFFVGINVLGALGIHVEFTTAPIWHKILPSTYLILIVFAFYLAKYGFRSHAEEKNLFILFFCMLVLLLIRGAGGYIGVLNCFIMPVAFSYTTSIVIKRYPSVKKKLRRIVLMFFLIECSLAIIEKILGINVFPFLGTNETTGYVNEINTGFRSTALQNHPLQNALCVSIVMAFILCSDYKLIKKFILFFFGYIALLCFNTRGSIVLWAIFFAIYILKNYHKYRLPEKIGIILLVITFVSILISLIINYGFGERLLNFGLLDESSAGQRILIFGVFNIYSLSDMLLGLESDKLENSLDILNVGIVENPWLAILFSHGLIVLIFMVILFYQLFKRLFICYTKFNKLYLSFTFLIIASTNNSLVTPGAYLPLFIICSYIFSEKNDTENSTLLLAKQRSDS